MEIKMREMIDYGVLGFLIFLSIVVVGIILERIWFYATMRITDYRDKRLLEIDLYRRLTLIATIGSNAPYVGLLGTVVGIMVTFVELGSSADAQNIMVGLSLALKATAAGLLVAIPSIVSYNLLVRKAEVILMQWDIAHRPSGE